MYVHTLSLLVQVFRDDGGDIQTHWMAYTEQMDRMVEEALRLNVKWSLLEVSRAINGDGKTTPNPLFKVKVVPTDKVCVYSVHMYVHESINIQTDHKYSLPYPFLLSFLHFSLLLSLSLPPSLPLD